MSDQQAGGDAFAAMKRSAAAAAVAAEIQSGLVVGLGSGSTVLFMLEELGRRVREERLQILGVPSSERTARVAREQGIPLADLSVEIDVDLDGADEVDPRGTLTKGGGGAMTREKCLAAASRRLVVLVDHSKLVRRLAWPVPLEVLPFAVPLLQRELVDLFPGTEPRLRMAAGVPFVTDNGNRILDLAFTGARPPARRLDRLLKAMTGLVEHGLFVGMKPRVYIGAPDGVHVRDND